MGTLYVLQSLQERLQALESSVCSLRSEMTLLRHAVTGQVKDQILLKSEVLKHMGLVGESCERVEKRLDRLMEQRGITVQTNVKQSLLSCPKGCTSLTRNQETSHSMEKKRKAADQYTISHEASTKAEVRAFCAR